MAEFVHERVRHTANEYVRGEVYTNGIESFWVIVKRVYMGVYHYWSFKHLFRYVKELSGRFNQRAMSMLDRIERVLLDSVGKQLRYRDLIAEYTGQRSGNGGEQKPENHQEGVGAKGHSDGRHRAAQPSQAASCYPGSAGPQRSSPWHPVLLG